MENRNIIEDGGAKTSSAISNLWTMKALRHDTNLRRLGLLTVAVFVAMSALRPSLFLSTANLSSMAFQFPEFGIIALAVMIAMVSGGIDLSSVRIATLSGIVAALILKGMTYLGNWSIALAVVAALATGVLCGIGNGLLISRLHVPPFLATLGTGELFAGIAIVITKGRAVYGFPESFTWIGNAAVWGIPVPVIVFAMVATAIAIVLGRTTFGSRIYMLGTNPVAAKFSGIDTSRTLLRAYALSGFLSAIGGLAIISRTNSVKADYGSAYVLQAVLVSVMGGVDPSGGFGTVPGVCMAILILQMLSSGFSMARFSNLLKEFVWGALLLSIMVVNVIGERRRSKARTSED